MLGGVRQITVFDYDGAEAGIQPVATLTGGVYSFTAADPDSTSQAALVTWNAGDPGGIGLGGIDITEGGLNDRFVLDLIDLDQDLYSSWIDIIDLAGGHTRWQYVPSQLTPADAPAMIEFLFSDLAFIYGEPADLTSVRSMNLRFSLQAPGSITVGSFQVIPEPSTLWLIMGGLVFLPGLRPAHPTVPGA